MTCIADEYVSPGRRAKWKTLCSRCKAAPAYLRSTGMCYGCTLESFDEGQARLAEWRASLPSPPPPTSTFKVDGTLPPPFDTVENLTAWRKRVGLA